MGIFKGIELAQASEGGVYLDPGIYDVVVQRIIVGTTRKNVNFVALDFQISATSRHNEHPVGSIANFFCGADKERFLGNVKAVAAAILANDRPIGEPFDMSVITEDVMEGLCANNGAAAVGQKLRVQVTHVLTKTGGTYARHQWSPGTHAPPLRTTLWRPAFPLHWGKECWRREVPFTVTRHHRDQR